MTREEEFWGAERILDEKKENGISYFLIQWLGEDSKGDPWNPTWEPKENCTVALIKEWEVVKGERKRKVVESRPSERRLTIISRNTLSEGGDGGDVGDVGDAEDDHDSSETSTIMDEEDEVEPQNRAEEILKENRNTTTSGIFSAVAGLIGISTSQKRPQSESSRSGQVNEAKKIRTSESLDGGKRNDAVSGGTEISVAQKPPQIQSPTEKHCQNLSFQTSNEVATSDKPKHPHDNGGGGNSYVNLDSASLTNEINRKIKIITCLLQEKERYQRKLKQYEKNRRFHRTKNQVLARENIQSHKLLQEKQTELTRTYAQLNQVLDEFKRVQELCSRRDAKMKSMEIELEEHRRQFDAKHRKDQKQIALLQKANNSLTIENEKLLQKTEALKVSGVPNSDSAHLGQTTRSSGGIQALRTENEMLNSKVNNLNLQCSLQQQNLVVLEEKVLEQESLIRLLMDIQKLSCQGDQKAEDLKRTIARPINLQNAPPVYTRPPNQMTSLPPLEFIPWNGMSLKN